MLVRELAVDARESRRNRRLNQRTLAIAGVAIVLVAILAAVGHLGFFHTSSKEGAPSQAGRSTVPPAPKQVVLPFEVGDPDGVAVDGKGDVYVADSSNNRVLKLPAGSDRQSELPFTGLNRPAGLALDVSGGIYLVDAYNNRVLKLPAGSPRRPSCLSPA
ncbi:hypothetical protein NIIDMKKI_03580 [Mycobacterium kansasii]|uniref:NHL repeat family protein n=1 Tax=Mycobacterium kansasii TaxID=1768 RepID=A0A7G1I5Y1_MYCKA|nr:hypothetical protein NIIDMKKI_03580 [Mycobacterium kansasii]